VWTDEVAPAPEGELLAALEWRPAAPALTLAPGALPAYPSAA
jgi:hypothetical protein